ncbi:hypothetical protein KR215_010810 [Drosophila sulfurigaster]|nr:hypothetical protein KR215_010810 [Drosophila sulfurigaster]
MGMGMGTGTGTGTGTATATSGSGLDVVEQLDLGILSGRSISLPPRSSLELGNVDLAVRKAKKPPCHKHHIDAIEKSTTAAVAALARHRQRKTSIDKLDSEQLMAIDETLKQRLAVRFDREREREREKRPAESNVVAARMLSARPPAKPAATTTMTTTANKEQTRFQTLGERIQQFECMQFANGPAAFQAFSRRQGHGNGRVSLMGNKHIPKQQPCLSFRNVLHTNHRQRCLLSSQTQTRSQSVSSSLPLAPAKAKSRTKTLKRSPEPTLMTSWRPQQQQQQQQHQQQQQRQLQPSPAAPSSIIRFNQAKLKRSKSRRYIKTAVSSSSGSSNSSSSQSSNRFLILDGPRQSKPSKMKANAKEHATVGASNHLSRSSHMPYIKHCGNKLTDSTSPTPSPSNAPNGGKRLAEQLMQPESERKVLPQRKMLEELPKQPLMAKGAHHLLAASASQVSAYRRAFKNRQQILQAELFHVYAHDQPQQLLSSKTTLKPKSPLPRQAKSVPQTQASSTTTSTVPSPSPSTIANPSPIPSPSLTQTKKEEAKVTPPKPLVQHNPTPPPESVTMTVKKTKVAKTNASAPHASSSLTTLPELTTETSYMVIDAKPKWSPVLQQQQLHQQLRQRRQQPYDSLWRYNY